MIATLNFPTLLHFPLGEAQRELERVVKKMSPLAGANLATPLAVTQSVASNWWQAGGATGCVQALQPKSAVSYAASLLDLSGNGNNASEGVAPTFDASTGWTFNGTTQYLESNISHTTQTVTILLRFSSVVGAGRMFSSFVTVPSVAYFGFEQYGVGAGSLYFENGTYSSAVTMPASGVLAIAGLKGFVDGVHVVTIPASGGVVTNLEDFFGCMNSGDPGSFTNYKLQAFARYSSVLSDAQVAAVTTAMAAL